MSQETSPTEANKPSWKGVAQMKKVGLALGSSAVLACGLVAPAAFGSRGSVGPKVSVEIETLTKTLLKPTAERGEKGWITKGKTPRGKCPGNSAAGALDAATHGHWTGKYYASVGGIFVTSIDGVKPRGSDYWSVYVGGKAAQNGVCQIKLHAGEKLLFKIVK